MRFVETVANAGCSKDQTAAVFLDVEKAFDRVWRAGLIQKLLGAQLSDCYVHLIASFLESRTFCVKVDFTLSSDRAITAGVSQGSVLEPLLFFVYVNDVPKLPVIERAIFADYTVAYTVCQSLDMAVDQLQNQLDAYLDWADEWRIAINAAKSTAVVFSRRRNIASRLRLDGIPLRWFVEVK